ncbi:MAG TPA: tRNA preQ1(34) S-adenosylmethionine ribosyltransferase-isomerase QueA [Planctomycetota bacterium]|nr:tRNA preQ1(34) S-adenosylmethionine ribosyltransferase-isomerase QueA [Planctomycetota bacterium]
MDTADFDYDLPPELIAQHPVEPRDAARLMVCVGAAPPEHACVADLGRFLRAGDLLVVNRTRVFPARLDGRKDTGGEVEVLLVQREGDAPDGGERWRAFVRGRVRVGTCIAIADSVATVSACDDADRVLDFPRGVAVLALAERHGHVPLPPYIRRADEAGDRERYQTVFADRPGSVAAPTAALHLTTALIDRLVAQGVELARVDLAIGPGTFKPVQSERIEDHPIHAERGECPAETVAAIARCRARGGRVVAVGTTVVRTLESAARQPGGLAAWAGWTRLYLHPPERLRVVDALLTNFHLPRSTLLMLVSCLTGVDRLLALYAAAIAERYRFFSYGDAMLILPQPAEPSVPAP